MRMPLSPRARNALAKRGGGGGVYRAKLPKKRGKLDCLYYSPFAFDKYGCKCKTGPGSARPETRFHSYSSRPRARIGVTYLAKFLPSRQSHSINSECTYLPRAATCARARARGTCMCACVRVRAQMYIAGFTAPVVFPLRIFSEIFYTSRDFYALYASPLFRPLFLFSLASTSDAARPFRWSLSRSRDPRYRIIASSTAINLRAGNQRRVILFPQKQPAMLESCTSRASSDSSEFIGRLCASITYSCGCIAVLKYIYIYTSRVGDGIERCRSWFAKNVRESFNDLYPRIIQAAFISMLED